MGLNWLQEMSMETLVSLVDKVLESRSLLLELWLTQLEFQIGRCRVRFFMRVRKKCSACTKIAWQRARSFADVTNWAKSLWSLCQQPTYFLLRKGDSKSPTCDERQTATKNIRETRWIGLNVSDARHVGVKLCACSTTHTFAFPLDVRDKSFYSETYWKALCIYLLLHLFPFFIVFYSPRGRIEKNKNLL